MKKTAVRNHHAFAIAVFSFLLFAVIGCRKQPPTNPEPPAQGYFFSDKSGRCSSITVHGLWYNGFPANTDTNYVDVSVYVTRPGSYTISSDTVNGVKFTGTGEFPDTGMAVARLKGTGSFRAPGNYDTIHIHFDSTDCRFGIAVNDSAGLSIAGNTWTFTAEGHVYSGPFSAAAYDIPESPNDIFELDGYISGHPDSALFIGFGGPNVWPLDTGYHRTTDPGAVFEFHITDPNIGGNIKTIYLADKNTAPAAVITVHIVSRVEMFAPNYQVVNVATFNGTAVDSTGKVVTITNGKFKWVAS
ncbi:MAG TPA: hypothetical protein VIM64_14340 [Puia sp.]